MKQGGQQYYLKGMALEKVGDHAGAFDAFRHAAKHDPLIAAPYMGLARILKGNHQRADAIACLERAVACEPENIMVLTILGRTLIEEGRLGDARRVFENALQKAPNVPDVLLGLGVLYEDIGDRAAAEEIYRRLLRAHPGHAGGLVGLLSVSSSEEAPKVIDTARDCLASANDSETALIGYALGKALDRLGDINEAFKAMSAANDARRRDAGSFDREAFDGRIDQMCEIFNAKFIAERQGWGSSSNRPIFVVGLPRSGTTLTEQMLSAHPQVYGAGELDVLADLATGMPDRLGREDPPWPEAAKELTQEHLRTTGEDYLDRIGRLSPASATKVVDKQPLNFWHLGLVALALPNAQIVHCRRDIRDCGLSIFSENFTSDQRWATDLSDIAYYWCGYKRLMRHWESLECLQVLDIDYEGTVMDMEAQSRRLFELVGVSWTSDVLSFHEKNRAVQTPSRWQVRQPIYQSSKGRWKPYKKHLGALISAAKETL